MFSRDAENSSREIVPSNTKTLDEFVEERVFLRRVENQLACRAPLRVAAKRADTSGGSADPLH